MPQKHTEAVARQSQEAAHGLASYPAPATFHHFGRLKGWQQDHIEPVHKERCRIPVKLADEVLHPDAHPAGDTAQVPASSCRRLRRTAQQVVKPLAQTLYPEERALAYLPRRVRAEPRQKGTYPGIERHHPRSVLALRWSILVIGHGEMILSVLQGQAADVPVHGGSVGRIRSRT